MRTRLFYYYYVCNMSEASDFGETQIEEARNLGEHFLQKPPGIPTAWLGPACLGARVRTRVDS